MECITVQHIRLKVSLYNHFNMACFIYKYISSMVSKKCKLNFIQIQTIKSHSVFFTVGAVRRRRRHGYPVDRADSLQYFAQGLSQFG